MSLSKVIEIARGELGVTEDPPGSNRVKYWDSYDPGMQGQPWCVCFLWWCFREAGESPAFYGGEKTASCSALLRWYRGQGLTVPAEEVQRGDIVLMNFRGGTDPEHCGIVEHVNERGGTVCTVEGNTSPGPEGSMDNGGCVALKERAFGRIVGVCRPQYRAEADLSAPSGGTSPEGEADLSAPCGGTSPEGEAVGHWAEKSIRWCVEHGLMTGYPDGSFRPDKPVTRAELATVLRRLAEG